MDVYNDKLLPYLTSLQDTIDTHDKQMTPVTITKTKKDLRSIVLRLNNTYNSRLRINRVDSDILYDIFVLAVLVPSSPFETCSGMTAVRISSVCRHWRTSALGWPILWTSINIPYSLPFLKLLMSRSGNAPLDLIWAYPLYKATEHDFDTGSSIIPHLFTRIRSLTLCVEWADFHEFWRVCQKLKSNGLLLNAPRLQSLVATVCEHDYTSEQALLAEFLPIDVFRLQTLELCQIHPPWLTPPRSGTQNNLTNLELSYSINLPDLSQVLIFLSYCHLLNSLKLNISKENYKIWSQASSKIRNGGVSTISRLDLNNLKTLLLESEGIVGYDYIGELAACIRAPGLSRFHRSYMIDNVLPTGRNHSPARDTHRTLRDLHIFETIPPDTLCQFSELDYLSIGTSGDHFGIRSKQNRSLNHKPMFRLFGEANSAFDYSPIIELLRKFPKLTHLRLYASAWSIFTTMSFTKIRALLPCLHTLELSDCRKMELLNSPLAFLKPKTLMLDTFDGIPTPKDDDSFLKAVLKMEVQVLIVQKNGYSSVRDSGIVDALTKKGIRTSLE